VTYGKLSPRQKQILQLTADGFLQREIAGILTVQRTTVRENLARAREMLGVTTTTAAVATALRRGLIS